MKAKLKISVILLTLLFAIIPLTQITVSATTFDMRMPSFGLYCQSQNVELYGKVKYVIDESGNAVQYSEYTVNGTNELNFKIPFISNACELPPIDLTVNQKAVTGKVCYGNSFRLCYDEFTINNFYNTELDESITGTLYTLTPTNERLTVDLKTCDNQNFIYLLPNLLSQSNNNSYSFTLDNARLESAYEIYALNGDFEMFESNADTAKQTLSLKEYIDRNYNKLNEYYSNNGNIKVEFFYSIANGILKSHANCELSDLFVNSITKQRLNAYAFSIETNNMPCVIAYSMPVNVQKNTAFEPAIIFLTEQTATGNYNVDYTIELNGALPYVIESSAEIKRQSDYSYTAQNVTDDFYFVFSSSQKPETLYGNNKNDVIKIVLTVVLAIAICALAVLSILIILHFKKAKK